VSINEEDQAGALASIQSLEPEGLEISVVLRHLGEALCEHFRFDAHLFYTPNSCTRLIAVLGVPDAVSNDWLISDFCLLHKILGGVASEETWLGSSHIDLHQLVTSTGKGILHGYGGANRRVVFSKDEPNFMTHAVPHQLKQRFLDAITGIAAKADDGERIMIIIVGHGNSSGEVGIGTVSESLSDDEVLTREEVEAVLAPAKDGVEVTILTTACYSGLWAVPFEALHTQPTVLAATEATEMNWSFPKSGSGRNRGSFHVAAVSNQFETLANKRVQPNRTLGTAACISSENIRPLPLIRAISLGDLTRTAVPLAGQSGSIASFCARLRHSVTKWPVRHGTNKAKPSTYLAQGKGRKSAAEVLGMDDPQALLWKVEGIKSLATEDKFTTIALGVSTLRRQRQGQAAASLREGFKKFSWLESSEAIYQQMSGTLQSGCPEDMPICAPRHRLMIGTITDEDAERYWAALLWRYRQNLWAGRVVARINPSFRPFGTFTRPQKYEFGRYNWVLSEFRVKSLRMAPAGYLLPDMYIVAAAEDADVSAEELRRVLQTEKRPNLSKEKLVEPQIPPRTSSRMQPITELPTPLYLKLAGSWDSVTSIDLTTFSVMLDYEGNKIQTCER